MFGYDQSKNFEDPEFIKTINAAFKDNNFNNSSVDIEFDHFD